MDDNERFKQLCREHEDWVRRAGLKPTSGNDGDPGDAQLSERIRQAQLLAARVKDNFYNANEFEF